MNKGTHTLHRRKITWYENNILRKNITNKTINWTKYVNKTYVLNLPRRIDRKQNIIEELSLIKTTKNGSLYNEITWWDGLEDIKEWDLGLMNPDYSVYYHWQTDPIHTHHKKNEEQMMEEKIRCSNAEISIALSHISILKDIVENNIDVACIMEDDIFVRYDFVPKMTSIFETQMSSSFDMIYLSSLPSKFGFTWERFSNDLLRVYNGLKWFSGFIITKHAAKKLLDSLPVVGPIDVWINHQFMDLEVYMTKENLFVQNISIPSDNTYSFYKNYGKIDGIGLVPSVLINKNTII